MNDLEEVFRNKYEHISRPNKYHDKRTKEIDGIIIHSMGRHIAGYGFAVDFLEEVRLSAHYLIDIDGAVIECVEPKRRAHHAGKSKLGDQTNLNDTFIGIEVLVEGNHDFATFKEAIKKEDTFKDKQYDSTAVMCALLCCKYDIPLDRIVKHSTVSNSEVRADPKKDPGSGFDWEHLMTLTEEFINQLNAEHE